MVAGPPDWHDRSSYDALLGQDCSGWAWEWLRRDPGYRQSAIGQLLAPGAKSSIDPGAARWGLHCYEDPDAGAGDARPLWRKDHLPGVISVSAKPGAGPDCFDVGRFGDLATMVASDCGIEHWLIADAQRTLRLDVTSGSLLRGPVQLAVSLEGFPGLDSKMAALARMVEFWRTGSFHCKGDVSKARAVRLARMLRIHDAVAAGATQRDIAEALFDPSVRQCRWRIERPTVRLQVQRLVRSARIMMAGGHRNVLGGY